MAISGKFLADFASFYDACQKAEVSLRGFDSGANKVETSLNRMADSFSGRKIIQEATLMAEAIEQTGGTTKLTSAELERASSVAEQAATKMRALGIDVPPNIQKLASASSDARRANDALLDSIGQSGGRMAGLSDASTRTSGAVSSLSSTYKQFDGALQAVGINIGPQVKGIEDIAAAATGGAGKIGLLGGAGLALGTGLAAWGLTRAVVEFLDLDKAVEKTWRTLLGYGDAAAEIAGAKQDVINRAIANGAKETISYKDAIEFNTQAVRRNADAKINWNEKLAAAHKEVRNLTDAQIREIEVAQSLGATTEQLTNKFGISADGLKVLAERQRDASRAAEEHRKAQEQLAEAMRKRAEENERGILLMQRDKELMDDRAKFDAEQEVIQKQRRQTALGLRDAISEVARANREAAEFERNLNAEQKRIDQENRALIESHQAAGAAAKSSADEGTKAFAGFQAQIQITGEAVREWINLMRYSAQVNAVLSENSLFTTQSQRDRIANISLPTLRSTDLGGTGGGNVSNTFNIVDTEDNIARRVADAIMRSIRSGGQLATA